MRSKGVMESLRAKKLISQKIIRNALRGAADPIDLEGIQALQVDGILTIEVFYANIGRIFPFILEKYAERLSITKIERLIGMNDRVLETILVRYPRLNEEVKRARQVRSDDVQLRALVD